MKNLEKIIVGFLQQNPEQKFTTREIADWIFESYPDECRQKQKRSKATVNPLDNENALLQQIVAEIGSQRPRMQKRYPEIRITKGRPRKYYFVESTGSAIVEERDLYPILSKFLWSELEIYSKHIDEERSHNYRGAGDSKWLYPDLVGMENLSGGWLREIKECVQQYGDKKTKLWSFEVTILINRSNVREVFFQTVSNSSWANFGYLVASEIDGEDTLKELRMLLSLHGIGFIRLDAENLSESQIMVPAKERSEIDWDTVNRLTEENKDFLEYIKLIRRFYQAGNVRQSDWD